MQLRITVEVFGDDGIVTAESNQKKAIAEGKIVGDLDLKRGATTQPVLSIRMRNILANVQETIYEDSNS